MPTSSLGANWMEVHGDSKIVAGELQIPAGGMVIAVPTPDRGAMKVGVTMRDLQPYKIYRVIINWTNTPSESYYYVEYECTDTPSGADYVSYLRVGSSGGGTADEIADTYTTGADYALGACRTPGGLYGISEHSEIVAWECQSEPSALYAGLANASSSLDIEFDDFSIYRYEGTDSPIFPSDPDTVHRCYYCACECDGYCIPETLTLTIVASGLSACVDGTEVTLTYTPGKDPFQWHGSTTIQDPLCGSASTVNFYMTCNQDQSFTIYTDWAATGSGWSGCSYESLSPCNSAEASAIQCSPLEITFGPFVESVSEPCDPCDGTINLIVTE